MPDSYDRSLPDHVTMPLLTLVTRQSLDQDYAFVAQRRAAGGEPPPSRSSVRPTRTTGTGEYDGKQVKWVASRIQATKTLFVIAFGTAEDIQKHQAEIDSLRSSVKKIA